MKFFRQNEYESVVNLPVSDHTLAEADNARHVMIIFIPTLVRVVTYDQGKKED